MAKPFGKNKMVWRKWLLIGAVLPLGFLTGCSGGLVVNSVAAAGTGLVASPSSLTYGTLPVGQSAIQTATVTNSSQQQIVITSVSVTDSSFKITDTLTLPLTLQAGASLSLHIAFQPLTSGAVTAQVLLTSTTSASSSAQTQGASSPSNPASVAIALQGTATGAAPAAPSVSGLSCASPSITGSGTDTCTVTLSGAAPNGGVAVSLSSTNASVSVPASITVSSNSTSATFSATIAAVTTAQTATVQASADGSTQSVSLQLNAVAPVLTVNATSINFGSVNVNTPSTQSLTLSSTGNVAVTVSGATASGTGFSITSGAFPMTLNPGQSATLSVQFDPTATGSVTGQLTIASNSSTSATLQIALSGTGQGVAHSVTLTWDAPASSADPVANYAVYRASGGSTSYQSLGSTPANQTTYVDSSVVSGQTYDYVVRSVDASGVQSSPSNVTAATIP